MNVIPVPDLPIERFATMAPGPDQPSTILALTTRMSRAEEAAFHEFHALYCHRLLCYLLVTARGDEEAAREALQLTFVRVARHARRFASESAFWSWLTVLARSSLADEQRKRGRYQGLLARFFHQQPEQSESDFAGADTGTRFAGLLQEAIAALPAEERELVEEKYFEGKSVRDLAGSRGATEKAIESHLSRIRCRLKATVLSSLKKEAETD